MSFTAEEEVAGFRSTTPEFFFWISFSVQRDSLDARRRGGVVDYARKGAGGCVGSVGT